MKDTRKQREMVAVFLVGGIGAVVATLYLKPLVNQKLGVRR